MIKHAGAVVKSRAVPPEVLSYWQKRISQFEPEVAQVIAEEAEEKVGKKRPKKRRKKDQKKREKKEKQEHTQNQKNDTHLHQARMKIHPGWGCRKRVYGVCACV